MIVKTYVFLPVVTLVWCLFLLEPQQASAAPAQQSSKQQNLADYHSQLASADDASRQRVEQQILQSQQSLELMVQGTAEKAITESDKASAASEAAADEATRMSQGDIYQQQVAIGVSSVELLGDLRAEASIPFLVKNFLFQNTKIDVRTPLEKQFPSYGALLKIGLPALNLLLEQASKTDQVAYQRVSVSLLIKVLGSNLAPIYLQEQIAQQKAPEQRKRLEGMADFLKTLISTP